MAAAVSCSARITENGTKQMGHVDSVECREWWVLGENFHYSGWEVG